MLKIVVYDNGWGEECVADYLKSELSIVEIERVRRICSVMYDNPSRQEIFNEAVEALLPYVGKCDVIVLGGYISSLVIDTLRREFPWQKFVGVEVDYNPIFKLKTMPRNIAVLTNSYIADSEVMIDLQMNCFDVNLIIPNTLGWDELLDNDMLSKKILRSTLEKHFILQKPLVNMDGRRDMKKVRLMRYAKVAPVVKTLYREKVIRAAVENLERLSKIMAEEERRMQSGDFWSREADYPEIQVANGYYREDRYGFIEFGGYDSPVQADMVLLLDTHLWGIRSEIEELFGWKTKVIDFRKKLLSDVMMAIGLKGERFHRGM